MTLPVLRVLRALLEDPAEPQYGLDLMGCTELASGSLYPILRRLEAAGWLESTWETVSATEVGRPRRRYYKLTGGGLEGARQGMAELSQVSAPSVGLRLRPGFAGDVR